ncbi:MAG TPA: proton-conducting transporter membrane subunit, partial [Candidatus Obscuribacterales bacterium]
MGSRFWVMLLSSWLVPVLFILWMAVALGALAFGRRTNHLWCSQLLGFSCLLLLWLSVAGWGQDVVLYGPSLFSLGTAPVALRLDSLASVFLGLLACVALAVSFFSPGYLAHLNERVNAGHYWAALFIFVLSMTMVTLSANALSFLVFWELMSLSSLALVASDHKAHKVQNAALIYLGATRCATGFLMGGFLWMYVIFHSLDFSQWSFASPSHWAPALMILIGLAIKAGIWPFHIWLPYAHPAAPSPISALMSGVMIKIALYAVIR